jgi:hypothetical protein
MDAVAYEIKFYPFANKPRNEKILAYRIYVW